jgi:vitamin-K-epoxide reductase (warfarin-sensitive)
MNPLVHRLMALVALLAVGGIVVSSVALEHHYGTSKTAFCDIGENFNCDIVNRSAYSSLAGIPVALIGMLGYAALVGLATVYRERRETPALLFLGALGGLAFALYLTYIEGWVLGAWCIVCLSSLALIAAITLVSGVLWLRSRKAGLRS